MPSNHSSPLILTHDFTEIVQQIVGMCQIPGLTLAVVHKMGPPEYGTWEKNSKAGPWTYVQLLSARYEDG